MTEPSNPNENPIVKERSWYVMYKCRRCGKQWTEAGDVLFKPHRCFKNEEEVE